MFPVDRANTIFRRPLNIGLGRVLAWPAAPTYITKSAHFGYLGGAHATETAFQHTYHGGDIENSVAGPSYFKTKIVIYYLIFNITIASILLLARCAVRVVHILSKLHVTHETGIYGMALSSFGRVAQPA